MGTQEKYIFITGGVLSSIGKGITAASIGLLMEQRGLTVSLIKMDPYLNVDPGTMSPFQHGEVFVLDDGAETDLDLGHYFRFLQRAHFSRKNSFTTGKIYDSVIRRERAGGYLGKTVQVIPHITDEIKKSIRDAAAGADVAIVEVGGTVGDIESLPFLEAIRQMRAEEGVGNVLFIHLTLVPYISTAGELKTKPTQHSVKELREIGIQPDLLLCRSDRPLPPAVKEKIGLFCNVSADCVFSAVDVDTIYEVPVYFHEEKLDDQVAAHLKLPETMPDLVDWKVMVNRVKDPSQDTITIGVIGKYLDGNDSYKSLSEALTHGGIANHVKVLVRPIDAELLEQSGESLDLLESLDGILVPGGFGERGVLGKIRAIQYARTQKIPFFGICLGLQLAVIEYARHVCQWRGASSAEFSGTLNASHDLSSDVRGTVPGEIRNVIDFLSSQKSDQDKGGTMRLGAFPCRIVKEVKGRTTRAFAAYQSEEVSERHRHRLEVSPIYRKSLEQQGLSISGEYALPNSDVCLVEVIELPEHPWFLGCQFHPEFLSRPLHPHPLFRAFIQAAMEFQKS